jgi:phosphatidylcholine synthase
MQPSPDRRTSVAAAWAVHALTASGALLGFLALEAGFRADTPATFLWLAIALVVDGIDGPLARSLSVARATPNIDGAALDLVVDYLTYVVAPVAWMIAAGVWPAPYATLLGGYVLITSLYTFARRDMKADSADFRGFPAVWNLIAAAFAVTAADPWPAALITIVLGGLTFTNLKVVHPVRVIALRSVTLAALVVWMSASGALIAGADRNATLLLTLWWIATAYLVGLCLWRSAMLARDEKKGA